MALGFLYGGNTNETPESIKRKRDLVRAIMGASNAPRNIGEGLNALGDGIVANVLDRRANAAEKTGTDTATSLFNSIIGTPSATLGATGSAMPAVSPTGNIAPVTAGGNPEVSDYIRQAAAAKGIDPNVVLRVAGHEGLNVFDPSKPDRGGDEGSSFGPFQLHYAGRSKSMPNPGLGDEFTRATGLHASDPSTWKQQVDFSLDWVRKHGWSPWMGAKAEGITGKMGVGEMPAQQPAQVASLDPSVGMPPTSPIQPPPINQPAPAPTPGYVDPKVVSAAPQPRAPMQGPTQGAPALPPPTTIPNSPQIAAVPPAAPPPQPVAQAAPSMAPQGQFGGVDPRLIQAMSNPFLNEGQRAAVQLLIQQQMQASQQQQEEQTWRAREDYKLHSQQADPSYQLEQDYKKAQLEALKNKTGKSNLINAGEGNIYDPDAQTWIKAPSATGQAGGAFRFGGNSVEAQSLNGLIESGQITPEQAQQLGAGKTITGPNNEILFLTPQGIFKQNGQGAQPQGQAPTIDLFGDNSAPQPQGVDLFGGQPQTAPQTQGAAQPNGGTIQITAPKAASNEQLNAAGFADRMHSAGQILDQNENQGLNGWDQFLTRSPFVPGIVGNTIVGHQNPDYQVFDQAKRDFINAQLRRESGAVIGKDEFDNADKQYFPQPGDSPDVIKQKREARAMAIESMGRSAGPNYKRPAPKAQESEDIKAARDAIAKGAPRDKVIERLQAAGIDTTGL